MLNNGSKHSKYDTRFNSQVINFRNSDGSFRSPMSMKTPRGELTSDEIPKIPLISDYGGGDITTPILSEDHGSMTTDRKSVV